MSILLEELKLIYQENQNSNFISKHSMKIGGLVGGVGGLVGSFKHPQIIENFKKLKQLFYDNGFNDDTIDNTLKNIRTTYSDLPEPIKEQLQRIFGLIGGVTIASAGLGMLLVKLIKSIKKNT